MSKKNETNQETAVTLASFHPINNVPDKAPAPQLNLDNPNLAFDDVLPSNYFSMEDLELWLEERGAESRVLTITGCTMEYVYDPEKGEATGDWKPCLSFAETATMLVINKTRGMQLKKLTNSPFLREWAKAGRVAIKPGIANGKAQIVITAVPHGLTPEEIDDMFSYG
ncbi:MAG: hypothetical protein KDE46_03175 [Caldilineaceae bacterium]|nr:hypothetical protein [Caldilineaceae bacterium]